MQKRVWLLVEIQGCGECGGGEYFFYGVVEAQTPEEIAQKIGGELKPTEEGLTLFISQEKFVPVKGKEHAFLLEYIVGPLRLYTNPLERGLTLHLIPVKVLAL